jgi:amidophosphoribosyltransferase
LFNSDDKPKEACGLFGIFGHKEVANLTYLGLYSLQHRGQESAGITVSDGKKIKEHKGMGLVGEVFGQKGVDDLSGYLAIGHVRYSTTGSSSIKNAQPFLVSYGGGSLAIAHNGNLVNARSLHDKLESEGSIFQSTMDSEILVHLIARSKKRSVEEKIADALSQVKGAYSLLIMTRDQLIGARDPNGFRPLCLGKLKGSYILASETCALDLIQADYIREIEPGEIIFINKNGLNSYNPFPRVRPSSCIFEFIYFARPDSNIFGGSVYQARKRLGRQLAKEFPREIDLVMPIPDSGNYAALGFAEQSGAPFEMGFIRNHYIGRTFIQPSQSIRDFGVKVKLNPVREILKDRRILIVEDSIVRGTTSRNRIKALREIGVKEVHMRVSCPPLRYPCVYGIDFPTRKELIASTHSVEEIRKYLELDSLEYLSLEGLVSSMPLPENELCLACFNGRYPVEYSEEILKYRLEV